MPHALVMALFDDAFTAANAAKELRTLGIARERVSIVARSHDEEGSIAGVAGASPGSEIEDSPTASRLGELGAHLVAAIGVFMPGVGPIIADGPLAAAIGEAAGHLAGGIARALEHAGLDDDEATRWQKRIEDGSFLVGAHVDAAQVQPIRAVLLAHGGSPLAVGH